MKDLRKKIKKQPASIVIFLCVSFCCTVILNYIYESPLYELGIDIIIQFQKHGNPFWDYLFLFVTMFIDPVIVVLCIVTILIMSRRKKKAFIMVLFVIFNTFFAALLKAYHIDPRPIWTHAQVKNIGLYCPVQYGNPSGHSWFSAVFGFGFLIQYLGVGKYYRNIVFSILLCILVPLSRMYLGAHSLDQILYGLAMGLQVCILFSVKLKHSIESFLFNFRKSQSLKKLMVFCHLLALIPYVINHNSQLPENWIHNISRKCGKDMNQQRLNFLMLIVNTMLINVTIGIASGYHDTAANVHGNFFLSGNWHINRQKYGKFIGYILYLIIQLGCLLSGFVGGGLIAKLFGINFIWYICLGGGAYISGYVYTYYALKIHTHYQLIIQGKRQRHIKKIL